MGTEPYIPASVHPTPALLRAGRGPRRKRDAGGSVGSISHRHGRRPAPSRQPARERSRMLLGAGGDERHRRPGAAVNPPRQGGPRRPPRPTATPEGKPRPAPAPARAARTPPKARRAPELPGPRPERAKAQRSVAKGATAEKVRFKEAAKPQQTRKNAAGSVAGRPEAPNRQRSEEVPRVRRDWTGRVRAVRPDPATLLPPVTPATAFRQRFGIVHNTHGPRIRVGVLWALVLASSLAAEPIRPYGLALVMGIVAGVAALQVIEAWHPGRDGLDRWVAALGAATLPVLATAGARAVGAGLVALVLVAAVSSLVVRDRGHRTPVFAVAGLVVLGAGICGGAAASLVLLAHYEIGAVIVLLVFVMVYDASDFVVGSGSSNGIEGPLAGALSISAIAMLFAVTEVPPFHGVDVWNFAMLAAVACPAGQMIASAMLPGASAKAPALRRIDSMIVAAPAWAGLIGLYLQSAAR